MCARTGLGVGRAGGVRQANQRGGSEPASEWPFIGRTKHGRWNAACSGRLHSRVIELWGDSEDTPHTSVKLE